MTCPDCGKQLKVKDSRKEGDIAVRTYICECGRGVGSLEFPVDFSMAKLFTCRRSGRIPKSVLEQPKTHTNEMQSLLQKYGY